MKKVVFCEIAWMKYYRGISEDDKPMNGGKFIDENEDGGEVLNFFPCNHKCYGYVMHYGDELHIERYDKILKSFDEVSDMTVVWVASDGNRCKITGWYEHATMYRHWKGYYVPAYLGGRYNDYNFVADEKDCYLIDADKRSFIVPRAPQTGKGRGMGQSQVWYADSEYAQNEFIPKVLAYLDRIRDECKPAGYPPEELSKSAEDHGETPEELFQKCYNRIAAKKVDIPEIFRYINLALDKGDCYQTRLKRAELFVELGWYDEAEEEYKHALHHEENIKALRDLMYIAAILNHTFLAIELGEKVRKRKSEDEYWPGTAESLTYLYIDEGESESAQILMKECEKEKDDLHKWINDAKQYLGKVMKQRSECRV